MNPAAPRESSIAWQAGQLIVGGFDGVELPAPFAEALGEGRRGGAILFRRNLPDLQITAVLCGAIAAAAEGAAPPFVGVDEEGGRVSRLPNPFLKLPPMRALAAEGASAVRDAARRIGRQLRALGFNLDFAPVLDVDSNPDNPVIGDRSFGADPAQVAELGAAFAEGLAEAGIAACGKHFPGHGDTDVDSHLGLPRVRHDLARLREVEWPPFARAIAAGVPAMMTAHVLCEAIDAERIGTLSPILCGLLRRELGFRGVLFSDDLEMNAIQEVCGRPDDDAPTAIARAAVAAIAAGCDVVLICRRWDAQEAAHAAIVDEAERDAHFRARVAEAAERGLALRRRLAERGDPRIR